MLRRARININPVEGLQQPGVGVVAPAPAARININPVEGLQLEISTPVTGADGKPESTSTQSRDYNSGGNAYNTPTLGRPESTSTQSRDYNTTASGAPDCLISQNQHQPSRGITTRSSPANRSPRTRQNQHQPSRGITTFFSSRTDTAGNAWPESTSTQSRDYNNGEIINDGVASEPESTSTQSRDYNLTERQARWITVRRQNQHQPSRGITTASCDPGKKE